VQCDHRDDRAVAAVFERVGRDEGRLDLLVNNAAGIPMDLQQIFGDVPFWQVPVSTWDDLFTVGVRSHFVAAQHAAAQMVRQGFGLIVNVSSAAAQFKAGVVPYAVGKAAVDRMTADMAVELSPHGVSVISVWPPPTTTEGMLASATDDDDVNSWSQPVVTGRVIAALCRAEDLAERSGKAFRVRELAAEFGIEDVRHTN
jgi:dehydrogenase/reductase SDR family protein 1